MVDTFSNLADIKDAKIQGELFLLDGVLEFQMGFDGEIQNIIGREALVQAFAAKIFYRDIQKLSGNSLFSMSFIRVHCTDIWREILSVMKIIFDLSQTTCNPVIIQTKIPA